MQVVYLKKKKNCDTLSQKAYFVKSADCIDVRLKCLIFDSAGFFHEFKLHVTSGIYACMRVIVSLERCPMWLGGGTLNSHWWCWGTACSSVWLRLICSHNHQISPTPPEVKPVAGWRCRLRARWMREALSHRPAKDLDRRRYDDKIMSKAQTPPK